MPPFAFFTITAIMFALNAASPGNGAILVPNKNLRGKNAPIQKIYDDRNWKEEEAEGIIQQLYQEHSNKPDSFQCFKGNGKFSCFYVLQSRLMVRHLKCQFSFLTLS